MSSTLPLPPWSASSREAWIHELLCELAAEEQFIDVRDTWVAYSREAMELLAEMLGFAAM